MIHGKKIMFHATDGFGLAFFAKLGDKPKYDRRS